MLDDYAVFILVAYALSINPNKDDIVLDAPFGANGVVRTVSRAILLIEPVRRERFSAVGINALPQPRVIARGIFARVGNDLAFERQDHRGQPSSRVAAMLQRAPLGTGAIMATAGAISPIPPLVTEPISARGASAKREFIEYSK
jgi:hypothetical protein